MAATVVIDKRFCGPPESANGGYACAMAAQWIEGPAEVTLRAPPPLAKPLERRRLDDHVVLLDHDVLIAEARPTSVNLDIPRCISLDEARPASVRYPWRARHPYPTCFVCGPEREEGDGLQIFPGPVEDTSLYAAPWIPDSSLADGAGNVRGEFVWGALDCPSGIVTASLEDVGRILLGRLAADLRKPVRAGSPHVVEAWVISREGRKLHTASALSTAGGELCALADAVWIEVPPRG